MGQGGKVQGIVGWEGEQKEVSTFVERGTHRGLRVAKRVAVRQRQRCRERRGVLGKG